MSKNPFEYIDDQELAEVNRKFVEGLPSSVAEPLVKVNEPVYTCKEKAGPKNMTDEIIAQMQEADEDFDLFSSFGLVLFKKGMIEQRKRRTAWDPEDLYDSILEYFDFCANCRVRANIFGLVVWLGVSKEQFYEWVNNPMKYSAISKICRQATDMMANECIIRGEKFPAFNTFLLRGLHGVNDRQEVTVVHETSTKLSEIGSLVAKLGLNVAKEDAEYEIIE